MLMLACAVKTRKLCAVNCVVHRSGVTVDIAEAHRGYFSMDGVVSQLRKKPSEKWTTSHLLSRCLFGVMCEHTLIVPRLLCLFF